MPPGISAKINKALSESGATDLGEQKLWAARLTLPILSEPEIRTLIDQAKLEKTWPPGSPRPTPLKVVIRILAHRLQVEPKSLARKVSGAGMADYFGGEKNPIDKCLS